MLVKEAQIIPLHSKMYKDQVSVVSQHKQGDALVHLNQYCLH